MDDESRPQGNSGRSFYVATGVTDIRVPVAIRLAAGDSLSWPFAEPPEVVDGPPLAGPMTKDEYDVWRLRADSPLYPSAIVNDR